MASDIRRVDVTGTLASGTGDKTIALAASGSAVERAMPEQETRAFVRVMSAGTNYQTHSGAVHALPEGTLVLRLSTADRATFHGWMVETDANSGLMYSGVIQYRPDTATASTWREFMITGETVDERYEWLTGSDYWRIALPVVEVTSLIP